MLSPIVTLKYNIEIVACFQIMNKIGLICFTTGSL